MEQLEELHRELTRIPPEEFVAARDALVRRLRGERRREEAGMIARLRRPSPALWAVNALTEAAPEPLAELVRAADALREGTQAALQGRRADLGRLSAEHGRLVEKLTGRAVELLTSAGRPASGDTRARVWTVLRTASTDPQTAPLLERGTLLSEPVSTGFEGMEAFEIALPETEPARPAGAVPPREAAPPREAVPERVDSGRVEREHPERERAERESAERERAERERAERLRAATGEVEARSRRARELREQLTAVRERLEGIHAELAQAEREEQRLARAAEEADRAAGAARKELERLRG